MNTMMFVFWMLVFTVFYTYAGYGLLLFILLRIKKFFGRRNQIAASAGYLPEVTLLIPAFNEKEYVESKMKNTLELDYPADKLKIIWVTDGSTDGTPDLLKSYKGVTVLHVQERNGKIAAMNRGMQMVNTPIVVFSDANTLLGKSSVRRMAALFNDPRVGGVSGEKRILHREADNASAAGEGLYWKYESTLKKWDAAFHSVVGAAGELFAIRTSLYREVEKDTLLDDFIISLRVAQEGYTVQYDPEAYAIETASANVGEEMKRKIRISAGGIQSVIRLRALLNIFRYGRLSFQYISHRVLRWTLAPLCMLLLLPLGGWLAAHEGIADVGLYTGLFWMQILFYLAALAGWYFEHRETRIRLLFVPFYFCMMNLSVFLGFFRYIRGGQTVNWEKARRAV